MGWISEKTWHVVDALSLVYKKVFKICKKLVACIKYDCTQFWVNIEWFSLQHLHKPNKTKHNKKLMHVLIYHFVVKKKIN